MWEGARLPGNGRLASVPEQIPWQSSESFLRHKLPGCTQANVGGGVRSLQLCAQAAVCRIIAIPTRQVWGRRARLEAIFDLGGERVAEGKQVYLKPVFGGAVEEQRGDPASNHPQAGGTMDPTELL